MLGPTWTIRGPGNSNYVSAYITLEITDHGVIEISQQNIDLGHFWVLPATILSTVN